MPDVRRYLGMGSYHLDQHLIIFGTAAISFKPMQQGQCFFGAQIHLLQVFQEFEELQHNGLHLKRAQAQGLQISCLM